MNTNKSHCIRIGRRFFAECSKICTENGDIAWAKEVKYLGIIIESNRRFKISFTDMKCKFYASFNTMYSKLGHRPIPDLSVTIHLLESISVPILLYALEALNLNKSELKSLEFTFSKALYKIFRVSENLKFCMNAFNIFNISDRYILRKHRFLTKLRTLDNINIANLNY